MAIKHPTKDVFLKNVSAHKITILKDDGVYRHIKLRNPKSPNMWFEVITWPGSLHIGGDMGDYTFNRCDDMFEFFRDGYNPRYWSEKVESKDVRTGLFEFDAESFVNSVEEWFNECMEDVELDNSEEDVEYLEGLKNQLKSIQAAAYDGEWHGAVRLMDWEDERENVDFTDFFLDNRFDVATYHYMWVCYAIPWAISMYDKEKEAMS